jgi:hypothetical protein
MVGEGWKIMANARVRIFLSITLFALFFIVLRWNAITDPLIRDEGEYAYSAWLLGQNILPYANAFLQKPPLIIYTYLFAQWIAPAVFWLPRVIAALFVFLATILTGLIARREFGKGAGLTAMWIMTPLALLPNFIGVLANPEPFILFPLMAVLGCYIFRKEESGRGEWFLSGIFSAAALLYKPTVLPILLYIYAVWSFRTWRREGGAARLLANAIFCAAGIALASALALGYFLLRDGGVSLWECIVTYNRYYAASFQSPGAKLTIFMVYLKLLFSSWWMLFMLPVLVFTTAKPRPWFYIGLVLTALFSSYGNPHANYYIFIAPFMALVMVSSFSMIRPAAVRFMLTIAVILLLSWQILPAAFDKEKIYSSGWGHPSRDNPFAESIAVAGEVAALTKPEQRAFIAGSEPQILYYARRLSSTRFITMYPLMINTKLARGYQEELIMDLKLRPPEVIVFAPGYYDWLITKKSPTIAVDYIIDLLETKYEAVRGDIKTSGLLL